MPTTVRDFSISVRTPISHQRALTSLREALKRHGFETLCELPLDRELERKVGLRCQHCTVFVVWSPFHAYQAVLSDRDGGLLVPFNLCVAQEGSSTFIAVMNHGALSRSVNSLGVQVLVRLLADKTHEVLVEAAMSEEPDQCRGPQDSNVRRF
jgi:uncharacterized protein (DUF302 family)